METRESGKCAYCGKDLLGSSFEETETRLGISACNYECLENFYDEGIPEEEDFLIVPN